MRKNKILKIFSELFTKEKYPKVELRLEGRNGLLVYVEEAQECSIEFEMSGSNKYDILAFSEKITNWSTGITVTNEEKQKILESFKQWAESKKYRIQW